MRLHYAVLLTSALASFIGTADPAPAPSAIRLPVGPVLPPTPAPGPDATTRLPADMLYVIDSDVPCLVIASPVGLVSIVEDAGPVKFRGRFVDGTGKSELRTYKGKAVFTVEAIATGRVELLIVPQGATKIGDVIRRTVDADVGQVVPPPKPVPPDVIPDPPKPPAPGAKLFAVVFQDRLAADPAQAQALASKTFRDYLAAGSHEMEIVDIGTATGKKRLGDFQKTLDKAKVSPPAWVVMTADGTVYIAASLPPKDTDLVDALKKVTGK